MKAFKFVSLLLIIAACSDENNVEPKLYLDSNKDHLIFAAYANCSSDCLELYALQNNKLFKEESNYPALPNASRNFVELESAKYDLIKDLAQAVPDEFMENETASYGSGVAADRGVVYIEIKSGGVIRYCTIDDTKEGVPDYLHPLVDEIREKINLLR